MFANFIYLIIAILVYAIYQPTENPGLSAAEAITLTAALVVGFGVATRWFFRRLSTMLDRMDTLSADHRYTRLVTRQSIAAIALFAVIVHGLDSGVDHVLCDVAGRGDELADRGCAEQRQPQHVEPGAAGGTEEEEPQFNENLFKTVDELELSVRSANCLQNANIQLIGELVQRSEQDMLKTKNFGRKSLKEIKEILSSMGLSLGMKIDNWPQLLERWNAQKSQ